MRIILLLTILILTSSCCKNAPEKICQNSEVNEDKKLEAYKACMASDGYTGACLEDATDLATICKD